MRNVLMIVWALASLTVGVAGCVQNQNDVTLLTNASDSPIEACQRVLDALANSDTTAMHSLRITRFEHDSLLVPNMPIGKAEAGTTDLAYAWFLLEQNNIKGVRRAIDDYGGRTFRVVSIGFTKPVQQHGPVTLHKGTEVMAEDSTGNEIPLPIFGSVIEHGGKFKVVSIRD